MRTKLNTWSGRLLLALAVAVFHPDLQAGRAGYGQDFVRVDAQAPRSEPVLSRPAPAAQAADLVAYRRRLVALETQQGPYADSLAEPLAALGYTLRERGDYAGALRLYARALHVVRVNDGLYSERQVPLVRELLATYRQARDWQSLDERYQYYFRLFGNGQPPLSELRLGAALEYMRWQREALRRGLGNPTQRMFALIELNDDLLSAQRRGSAGDYRWHRALAFSQLHNLYLLQQQFEVSQAQVVQRTPGFYYAGAPPVIAEDLDTQRMDNLLRNAPGKGRQLLSGLLPAARSQGARELASVQLALADWYLWNRQQWPAASAYRQVIALLNEAGEPALVEAWLGEPQELPAEKLYTDAADMTAPTVVGARYDVSSQGRLTKLEVALLSGGDEQQLGGFRRQFTSTRFRPRWSGGEAEAVSGLEREYRLLD